MPESTILAGLFQIVAGAPGGGTLEQACAAAIQKTIESRDLGMTLAQMLGYGFAMVFCILSVSYSHWSGKRIEKRLEESRNISDKHYDAHRAYSQDVVKALMNPCAKVTFSLTPPALLEKVTTEETVITRSKLS